MVDGGGGGGGGDGGGGAGGCASFSHTWFRYAERTKERPRLSSPSPDQNATLPALAHVEMFGVDCFRSRSVIEVAESNHLHPPRFRLAKRTVPSPKGKFHPH